jgi:hypothetical protein
MKRLSCTTAEADTGRVDADKLHVDSFFSFSRCSFVDQHYGQFADNLNACFYRLMNATKTKYSLTLERLTIYGARKYCIQLLLRRATC